MSTTPSDKHFFASLFRRKISESVNPSDSYPETPTSSTPPTTSTSLSSTPATVPTSVLQTLLLSIGPSGLLFGLNSHLSPAIFSSGPSKGEGETAARTTDSVSAWDELMSLSWKKLFLTIFKIELEDRG